LSKSIVIDPETAKFWSQVDKHTSDVAYAAAHHATEEDGSVTVCWTWKGATDREGYGRMRFHGKQYGTHQVALMIANNLRRWPSADVLACHMCDNPPCCRPSHLFFGSVDDNNQDARRKGHMQKKLTFDQIAEIREQYLSGKWTQQQLADAYDVDQTAISKALRHG